MIGAIILTADTHQEVKVMAIKKKKMSSLSFIFSISYLTKYLKRNKISAMGIPSFFELLNNDSKHSEGIIGNLIYFIIANIVIGLLLLFINSYFSLSVKYLEKGGGFECGFTSFVQTRERFNVIFYRVSLLFLVFDLEIILAFPYPAIYQKNQTMSKNNILAFLYILIVGFIYELKEGALNIVKKAHNTEISIGN
jgi:NADH:ubiquinone oxidoreductase subunit 3 (subunit A)